MTEAANGKKRSFRLQWSDAVLSKDGPPKNFTRLALLALAKHMDANGGSCFPSIKTLAVEAAMDERSVRSHLARAEREGWIFRWPVGPAKGQGWRHYNYQANIPEGAESLSSPSETCGISSQDVRNEVPEGAESLSETCGTRTRLDYPMSYPKEEAQGEEDLSRGRNSPRVVNTTREVGNATRPIPDYAESPNGEAF